MALIQLRAANPTAAELNALAAALWNGATLEEKGVAIQILGRFERTLDGNS